jgi:hypothetical protein
VCQNILWRHSPLVAHSEAAWQVRSVIVAMGFVIENEGRQDSHYTSNTKSMLRVQYDCIRFTARVPHQSPAFSRSCVL